MYLVSSTKRHGIKDCGEKLYRSYSRQNLTRTGQMNTHNHERCQKCPKKGAYSYDPDVNILRVREAGHC